MVLMVFDMDQNGTCYRAVTVFTLNVTVRLAFDLLPEKQMNFILNKGIHPVKYTGC